MELVKQNKGTWTGNRSKNQVGKMAVIPYLTSKEYRPKRLRQQSPGLTKNQPAKEAGMADEKVGTSRHTNQSPEKKLSRSTAYRRRKRARDLGCSVDELPDGRGRHKKHARGDGHPRWKGGIVNSSHGYWKVQVGKEHPLSDPNGYAYVHLLVWLTDGRPRPPAGYVIHHRDEDTKNNRIDNLELRENGEHLNYHARRARERRGDP